VEHGRLGALVRVVDQAADQRRRGGQAERREAEQTYQDARNEGRQAALVTREAPDVFTLQVAGIKPDEDVSIVTNYAQLCRPEGDGWSLLRN